MTIDIIKNVLNRIMTINQNLTEESLRNLLIASSWDEIDIKEGLNVFNSFKNGIKPDDYQPITKEVQPDIKKVEEIPAAAALEVNEEIKTNTTTDFIFPYSKNKNEKHNAISTVKTNEDNKQEEAGPSLTQDINKDIDLLKSEEVHEDDKSEVNTPKKENEHFEVDSFKITDEVMTEVVKEHTRHKRPFGLIILDSVLFLIVIMLIFYILLV